MKKLIFIIFCILLLSGCASKQPSQAIVESARKEVQLVKETVKKIEKQTPPECKTDVFLTNLETIQNQVSSIGAQIENIGLSCQVEKQVLEAKITTREVIILCLFLLLGGSAYLLIRRR